MVPRESPARTIPTRQGRPRPRSLPTTSNVSFGQQGFELVLVENVELQFLCLLQLRAGARSGHNIVRFGAHASGGLPTQLAHHRLRVRAAHRLQRAGEHEGFAGEWSIAEKLGFRGLDARREELLDERSARTLKVHVYLTRHARADSLDPAQILFGGALQLLDGSEIRRQQRGGRLADLGNAKRVQEMPQLGPAARCDTVEQVLGRLVGESIQLHELILAQPVEVARVFDCASVDELRECRVAKSLDVYDRGVMPQPLESLSAAEGIDAAMRDVWLLDHGLRLLRCVLERDRPARRARDET